MTCGKGKIGEMMFYAIIENGGKQYKAVEGQNLIVDLLTEEAGKKKTFDKVLLLVDDIETHIGTPYVVGASVDCTILEHFKGEKVTTFKYRPKERYRVKSGHRQPYSRLVVNSIAFPGKAKPSANKKSDNEVAKNRNPETPNHQQ